jgi:hypothetical protein
LVWKKPFTIASKSVGLAQAISSLPLGHFHFLLAVLPLLNRTFLLRSLLAATVVGWVLLAAGCGESERPRDPNPAPADVPAPPPDTIFRIPQFPLGRQLDTAFALDLDGDGQVEPIVTSLAEREMMPSGARADMIQIFRRDPATRHWGQAMADSAFWITTLSTLDVTGDRKPDVVADIFSGGNDEIASRGMLICSADGGLPRVVFHTDRGAPQLSDLATAPGKALLMHDLLWPIFTSHAAARSYVSDVVAFKDGAFGSISRQQTGYFLGIAQQQLEEYRIAREDLQSDTITVEEDTRLFTPAALSLLALERANTPRGMRSFWDSESEFLRQRLPGVQFQELDSMYAKGVERLR